LAVVAAVTLVAAATARVTYLWSRPFDYVTHMQITPFRADGLCCGVLLAYAYHARSAWWDRLAAWRVPAGVAAVALAVPVFCFPRQHSRFVPTFGYTCLHLAAASLIVVLITAVPGRGPIGRALSSRPGTLLAWLGINSYPIYLWQLLARDAVAAAASWSALGRVPRPFMWVGASVVYLAVAIGVGVLLAALVERPTLALRDRLFPGRDRYPLLRGPGLTDYYRPGAMPHEAIQQVAA
jgi:peptidoglycan/LPS O-acetylase OafA/YrhL